MFNAIVLSWFLTLGWVPNQYETLGPSHLEVTVGDISTVAQIGFSLAFDDKLVVKTDIKSYQFLLTDSIGFSPYRADYTIGADYNVTQNVTLSASHHCNHEVIFSSDINNRYQSGETTVSATFKGKTKIR